MSFTISDYEARRDLLPLDGKTLVLPKRSCLARFVIDHRKVSEARLCRVTHTGKRGAEWQISYDALGTFYLAGPMRGYPLFNFPAFLMAARILQARGFKITSPAEKDMEAGFDPSRSAEEQKFDLGAAFRWDFEAVCRADGIILLPGWENSTGAKAERLVAQLCEREVYLLSTDHRVVEAPPMEYQLTWSREPSHISTRSGVAQIES